MCRGADGPPVDVDAAAAGRCLLLKPKEGGKVGGHGLGHFGSESKKKNCFHFSLHFSNCNIFII